MAKLDIIGNWLNSNDVEISRKAFELKRLYERQAKYLFEQYEPIKLIPELSGLPFINRLTRWLSGFETEYQWVAFHSLRYFLFLGEEEFEELYRCAVNNHFLRWIVDEEGIDIFSKKASVNLDQAISKCWPCPVTDSLRINSLLHLTHLRGQRIRPDWYSLEKLADEKKIDEYCETNDLKYLLLFEDFVGSGRQCKGAVEFALKVFKGKILLMPMVVCQPGIDKLTKVAEESNGRLTFRPVVEIGSDCLLSKESQAGEPDSFPKLREAILKVNQLSGFQLDPEKVDSPFGFMSVGCLYSSYSNCPNNTPPIFHKTLNEWPNPLFPRRPRI